MSIQFTCHDKATLIAYLYGEVDAATRQAVDDHLAQCPACADEVTALGEARSQLGLWAPPDVELDFQIVKKSSLPPANVLRPARWWNTVPAWAQAAAAILAVAAGLSIANLQIKNGPDGFSVSTGWMTSFDADIATSNRDVLAQDKASSDQWKVALSALEQQLRAEIQASRDQETRVAARGSVDDATLRRVQRLIADAEQRHSQELAARFVEFTRDINMQRRADLMQVSRLVGQYDEQLLRQRQILNDQGRALNNVIRVSSTPQQ